MSELTGFAEEKNRLTDLLARYQSQADYLAIRLERSEGTDIALRSGQVQTLCEEVAVGGQVRACYRGGWGFASFNRIEDLVARLEDAIAFARRIGTDETLLAPIDILEATQILPLAGTDPRHIPLSRKKALCHHYEDLLKGGDAITTTAVRYADSYQHILLATSEGTLIEQGWSDMEMRFSATAREGDTVQTGRETTGSRNGFEDLEGLDEQVASAAQRAITALTLPVAKGGTYTVVIDPILTGLFVHEAFGHLSEADMVYENPDLMEVMTMGRRFGPSNLQIYDGAAPQGHRGSYAFDDEGAPATTTQLIKDGELVGRLHSRETAGQLDEAPTGNARCLSYQYPPIVRMTNTWIERGDTPADSLIDDVDEGVFARNWLGGQTNGEMFTFAAGEAWMIR
ncbi:MAG: TldD/PmbA family protein, partial [Cyanobacteria bacterium J06627_15]